MTGKERAGWRAKAAVLEPIIQIGKDGISPETVKNIDDALKARELIKINVQKNCFEDLHELANTAAERTRSDVIQVIGRRFVLYRKAPDKKAR